MDGSVAKVQTAPVVFFHNVYQNQPICGPVDIYVHAVDWLQTNNHDPAAVSEHIEHMDMNHMRICRKSVPRRDKLNSGVSSCPGTSPSATAELPL